MRSLTTILIIAFLWIAVFTGDSFAQITGGTCKDCHVMHYGQILGAEGLSRPSATLAVARTARPIRGLTLEDCLGCHAQGGPANITEDDIPQVYHTDTNDLAAGNFKYVEESDARGHNVYGISGISADKVLDGANPPGYNSSYDPATPTKYSANPHNQVTCAGTFGCHGNRDYVDEADAMFGAHHETDTCLKFGSIDEVSQGTTVGTSYRFLYKVKGGEDDDWQKANLATSTKHNEYKGQAFAPRTGQTWADVNTISELCAECHGDFHKSGTSGIGTASPWLRHPTDVVLSDGEYADYNPDAPVARQTIPDAPGSGFTAGSDVVMCLSCHRAHGSYQPDLLRWDYSTMVAGGDTPTSLGCFTCHTDKDKD